MDENYRKARDASYPSQEEGVSHLISNHKLRSAVGIPLAFQPMGIASQKISDGKTILAVAKYNGPGISLITVMREKIGLLFIFNSIDWVRFGEYEVRIFPDIYAPANVNRPQTVNFGPNGTIWVSRNADREFFILSPPNNPSEKWTLTGRIRIPGNERVESAFLKENYLVTVESTPDLKTWTRRQYLHTQPNVDFVLDDEIDVRPYTYGFARNEKGRILMITDYCAKGSLGILSDNEMRLPLFYGNGLAFLNDGSAIISRYGETVSPTLGVGELIYIPSGYLD